MWGAPPVTHPASCGVVFQPLLYSPATQNKSKELMQSQVPMSENSMFRKKAKERPNTCSHPKNKVYPSSHSTLSVTIITADLGSLNPY